LAADSPAPKSVDGDALAHRFHAAGFATRYYSPDIHRAAFALPPYIQALLA